MRNNSLVKSLSLILFLAIFASAFLFAFAINDVVYAESSIRPSATNSSKIPEIIDKDKIKIQDPDNLEWSFYLEFLDLTSYFDTLADDYLTKEDPESHLNADKKSEIKISMHEDWSDISTKSINQINENMTDELAKQIGNNELYTKDNFEITYFFDLQIDDEALEKLNLKPENYVKVIFKLLEVAPDSIPPVVLYRCHDTDDWGMIPLEDVKNNNDYTVTVTFHSLCSILFVQTKNIELPDEPECSICNIPWWVSLAVIAAVLILVFIIRLIVAKKDDDDDDDDKGPYKEENEIKDEAPPIENSDENIENPQDQIDEANDETNKLDSDQEESSDAKKKYGDESEETPEEIEEPVEEIPETSNENGEDEPVDENPQEETLEESPSKDEEDFEETPEEIEEPQDEIEDSNDEQDDIEEDIEEEEYQEEQIEEEPPRKLEKLNGVVDNIIASNPSKKTLMNCTLAVASTYKRCKNKDDKKAVLFSIAKLFMQIKKK